jgi:hypothetical protein
MSPKSPAASQTVSAGGSEPPAWVPIVGVVFGVLTLLFIATVVFASFFGYRVTADIRPLVAIFIAFGAAGFAGFLGGNAAAKGTIPIPLVKNNAIAFSVGGGIAVMVIILGLLYWFYVSPANALLNEVVLPLPVGITRDFTIENLSPQAIADVGEVRTLGNKRLMFVEFRPGRSSGFVRLTYPKDSEFETSTYEVKIGGELTKRTEK